MDTRLYLVQALGNAVKLMCSHILVHVPADDLCC